MRSSLMGAQGVGSGWAYPELVMWARWVRRCGLASWGSDAGVKYTRSHEWMHELGNQKVRVGVTSHAAEQLGEIVFVDFPKVGKEVQVQDSILAIESVKTVAEVYSPIHATVSLINPDVKSDPKLINEKPEETWLCELEQIGSADHASLLTKQQYEEFLKTESNTH